MRRSIESNGAEIADGCRALLGLPPASANDADREERRRRVAYDGTWARAQRCIQSERARAAVVVLRFKSDAPEYAEAVARLRAVDDELDRLVGLYRRGAPLVAPTWPPLGGAGVGSAPVDGGRKPAAPGLFTAPRVLGAGDDFDDVLDAMGA